MTGQMKYPVLANLAERSSAESNIGTAPFIAPGNSQERHGSHASCPGQLEIPNSGTPQVCERLDPNEHSGKQGTHVPAIGAPCLTDGKYRIDESRQIGNRHRAS